MGINQIHPKPALEIIILKNSLRVPHAPCASEAWPSARFLRPAGSCGHTYLCGAFEGRQHGFEFVTGSARPRDELASADRLNCILPSLENAV